MADPNMMQVPPGTDPAEYARIMREQQTSDMLAQLAAQPTQLQQPQGSNRGSYQAARVGPVSTLSRLAAAVLSKKAMDKSATDQAQMYARGLQAFGAGGAPAAPAPPAANPGMTSADGSPAAPAAPTVAASPNPAGVTRTAMNPLGQDPRALYRLYQQDPAKYLDMIKGTPEWQTALAAYGGNVTEAQAAIRAKMTKEGAISNRSGEENMIPDGQGGYTSIRTPNLGTNQDYTRDPVTHQIIETHLIPGALTAEASQRAAETAATQANTPREVPIGGGATRLMYPGQVPGLGAPPGAAPQPNAPRPGMAAASGAQPPGQAAVPPPRQYFPQQPPAAPGPPNAAPPRAAIPTRSADGMTFDNNLPPNIPKMVIPSTPGQTSNAYQQAILSSAAKKHQELVDEYGKASATAVQSNAFYQQALSHLPAAEVGPMSQWLTENRSKLVEMAPSLAPYLSGDKVAPTLELNKALVNAGLQGAKENFGRLTEKEVMLQKEEMSPSAHMTRDAIANLVHQQQIRNAYLIQRDKDYSEYHAAGGDPNRFEPNYNVQRPLTRFAAQYDTPQAALERLKQRPELKPDFVKKFGWDPSQ